MKVEYDYLVKELEDKKQTIEKVKEEYDILKKNFCKNCIQEDQVINNPKSDEFCNRYLTQMFQTRIYLSRSRIMRFRNLRKKGVK